MAAIMKHTSVRYILDGRRVSKETPGAVKVQEESDKYFAMFREKGKLVRVPLCSDKKASETMWAKLRRQREREAVGLVDTTLVELTRPIEEHIVDFLAHLKTKGVCDDYYVERERCLRATIGNAKNLIEWKTDKIEKFINELKKSARTKEIYRAAAFQFGAWLVKQDRMEKNPAAKVTRPSGKAVRKRRALSAAELQKLLDVTRTRPVNEFSMVRTGPNKGKPVAKLKPEVRARLELLGRERSLIYKMAIYTGLRRNEIASLRVEHLILESKPFAYLQLPGEWTKNGEQARLLLIPSFAAELVDWIRDTRRIAGDTLFSVRNEMVKTMRADLFAAGIDYKDAQGRQADFHALRMTGNMMLGQAGVSPRVRQLFMRHGDIRLTLSTYDDSVMADMATAAVALEKVGLR